MGTTRRRILVVEDNQDHADLLSFAFDARAETFQLTVVATLAQARAALSKLTPDLVIADLLLPDGLGVELLSETAQSERFPVVVLTSHGDEHQAVEAMKAGALDYVVKSAETLADMGHIATRALRQWDQMVEREQAQRALREAEERQRRVLQNMPVMMQAFDSRGNLIVWNRECERVTGYRSEEVVGNRAAVASMYPDPVARQRLLAEWAVPSESYHHREREITCRDGAVKTVAWSNISDRFPIPGWAAWGTGVDVTEHKRMEEQMRQAQKMEAIGTLAGGIAHDFNNILATTIGYTELASSCIPSDSRSWDYLQKVLLANNRAKSLVKQILMFSRKGEQGRQPTQVRHALAETFALLRASLPTTIEIRQRLAAQDDTVLADPTQLQQVLMNLCINAEHAMRATGGVLEVGVDSVEIDARTAGRHHRLAPGPHVRLTVRDTGHGMAPHVQRRIFEPFFTTKGVGDGTGMGLAVVHGIVTGHGGAITLRSAPGQGTTFEVFLPRMTVEPRAARSVAGSGRAPHGKGRVLFVDDEASLVNLWQDILTQLGYQVVAETRSLEALETFRAAPRRFDLVVTDQTMPGMSGETLVAELRRIRPDVPVILCTGFSHVVNDRKARALGIDAFCMKPFTAHDLAVVIQQVLAQRKQPGNASADERS